MDEVDPDIFDVHNVSYSDFVEYDTIPALEDIQYVEYGFTAAGTFLTVQITMADFQQILEILCQEDTYYYRNFSYTYVSGNITGFCLHTAEEEVWIYPSGIIYSESFKGSYKLEGYYQLESECSAQILAIVSPYSTQALEDYLANRDE